MPYRYFILCLLVLLTAQACLEYDDDDLTDLTPPLKVGSISENAIWFGGLKGGRWVECSLVQEEEAHWCTIWGDQVGHIEIRKFFVEEATGLSVPEEEFEIASPGWFMYLMNGQRLVPRDSLVSPHSSRAFDRSSPIDPPRNPPRRPAGVSEGAIWAGDRPGETAWIECSVGERQGEFFCSVWSDQDGKILAKGRFTLDNWKPWEHHYEELLTYYPGFDGTDIALWKGGVLEPKSEMVKGDEVGN